MPSHTARLPWKITRRQIARREGATSRACAGRSERGVGTRAPEVARGQTAGLGGGPAPPQFARGAAALEERVAQSGERVVRMWRTTAFISRRTSVAAPSKGSWLLTQPG